MTCQDNPDDFEPPGLASYPITYRTNTYYILTVSKIFLSTYTVNSIGVRSRDSHESNSSDI